MESVKLVIGEYPLVVAFKSLYSAWQTTVLIDANQLLSPAERAPIDTKQASVQFCHRINGSSAGTAAPVQRGIIRTVYSSAGRLAGADPV